MATTRHLSFLRPTDFLHITVWSALSFRKCVPMPPRVGQAWACVLGTVLSRGLDLLASAFSSTPLSFCLPH